VEKEDSSSRVCCRKNRKKHGPCVKWEDDNRIETGWKEGQEHGITLGQYDNGQKSVECEWKDGVIISDICLRWFENGQKMSEAVWQPLDETAPTESIDSVSSYTGRTLDSDTGWYEDGAKRYETDGQYVLHWYRNGQKAREAAICDPLGECLIGKATEECWNKQGAGTDCVQAMEVFKAEDPTRKD
jgi:hypothetical protein